MFKKWIAALLCAMLLVSPLAGCSQQNNISSGVGAKDFPVTIGKVTISAEPTGTAVLSPNVADVVLALGYEINLKARSSACTQEDLSALPVVTADDAEKIKNDGANLVFTDAALSKDQQSAMEKAGITVLILEPASSRSDLVRLYSEVGSAMKGAVTGYEKGSTMANGVFETIDDVKRAIPESNTAITAVYLYDAEGSAATGDTIPGSLVKSSGLQNVAESATKNKYSMDNLVVANPKYIFCAKGVKAKLAVSAKLSKLEAVKQGRVYEMDPDLMKLQGEHLVNAVSFMAGTVYPQLLQGTASVTSSSSASSSKPSSSKAASSTPTVSTGGLNLNQTLRSGMENDDVLKMQNRLLALGYMFVKPTGLYAEGTEQAVKDFQFLNGIPTTGIADPATLHKIFSADAKKRTN